MNMKLSFLEDKKILILGMGKEGKNTLSFLRKNFPEKVLGVADQKDVKCQMSNVKIYFGKDYLKAIDDYDIIIKSPGISIHLPEIEKANKEKKLTSQTDIFFENCKGTIVGVTGTKGKSTTTTLIYQVLKEGGIRAHLIGNIGKPVLSYLLIPQKKMFFAMSYLVINYGI